MNWRYLLFIFLFVANQIHANEDLKNLGWLVGDWHDADDIHSTITYRWDLDKNFLEQTFSFKDGDNTLDGKEIIGWDPIKKKIHSWIYDSDGGFGESIWTQKDNTWYAMTNYTLSDGKKASALHKFTKVDENTYNVSSENRDINGEIQPNKGPFKVIRGYKNE